MFTSYWAFFISKEGGSSRHALPLIRRSISASSSLASNMLPVRSVSIT